MVPLARRPERLTVAENKQAYARAEERFENEPEQQPYCWSHNST